ncbi:MAG: glycosyltransferase family 4 protein [Dehalococcoidia bacterium]
MRILYVSQYYPPEMGAPAARVSELARRWAGQGHRVTVLTGFPNHPTGVVPEPYRGKRWRLAMAERIDGVDVARTWLAPTPNRKAWERVLNYASFCGSAALRGGLLGRPDVLVATSPQLLVGVAGWWLSRVKGCPFVFEVRDLWPESLVASGVGRERSLFIRGLSRLAQYLYGAASHVVTVSEAMKEELVTARGVPSEKVSVVENGVETDLFRPMATERCRSALGLPVDRFIVSYIGTLGLAHNLGSVLEMAASLKRGLPRALVLLVGAGADGEALREEARRRGLDNVRFFGQQPRERVPTFINASDLCLVTLRQAGVFRTVIPSKMLEFMACARPVVLAVDGQARAIVEAAGAGRFVPPQDGDALAGAVIDLERDPDERRRLGANGRTHVLERFHRQRQAERYLDLLHRVAAARGRVDSLSVAEAPDDGLRHAGGTRP